MHLSSKFSTKTTTWQDYKLSFLSERESHRDRPPTRATAFDSQAMAKELYLMLALLIRGVDS